MVEIALQYAPKLVYSGILIFLSIIFIAELINVWTDRRLYLAPFAYERDGEVQQEAGSNFARRISQSLKRVSFIYSGGGASDAAIVSTDQIDRALKLELPDVRTSGIDSVEVQAYGINFGSILRSIRGWVHSRNEIVGYVSHHGTNIDVQASIQGQIAKETDATIGTGLSLGWTVTDTDIEQASRKLACGIFRTLAASQSEPFRTIRDEDFCQFLDALESYQQYRIALPRNLPDEEKKKFLDKAEALVKPLLGTRFPYASKLAGLIYREKDDLEASEQALQSYLDLLKDFDLSDKQIEAFVEDLRVSITAAATPPPGPEFNGTSRVRPLTIGLSISSASTTAGSLCCFVQDSKGTPYALTADFVVPGGTKKKEVLQPGMFDGGAAPDDVIGEVSRILTPTQSKGTAAAALIKLATAKDVTFDLTIPGSGGVKLTKVAGSVKVGEEVYLIGRTSGIARGTVVALNTSVAIATGRASAEKFQGLIMTTRISRGGDGGGPVFNANHELIGLLYGGSEDRSMVMPIQPILDNLGVALATD